MQYFHPTLTSCTNYPICSTHILKNYELENEGSIASVLINQYLIHLKQL